LGEVQFINHADLEVGSYRSDSATESHIHAIGCGLGALPCGFDSIGDEVESSAAFHRKRRPRMMRQHKHIAMKRRILTPPALPVVIGPYPADRTEHVSSYDPGTAIIKPTSGEVVVNTGCAVLLAKQTVRDILEPRRTERLLAVHLPECARREKPFHETRATDAEGMIEALVRAGAVTIH